MDNRAYAFAFLCVLGIICLGAYVAVSALFDLSGDPLIRFDAGTGVPTVIAVETRPAGTRTATPTITPFLVFIPTIVFPTATPTPLPPTFTPTLPPLPTPRPLPTRTPTPLPGDSPVPPPGATALPPTPTNTPPPGGYPFSYSGPSVERRNCVSQYIIFGYVRDSRGQGLAGVQIRYSAKYPHQIDFPNASTRSGSEAGYYELTVGTAGNEIDVALIEAGDRQLSPSVHVSTNGFDGGNCWYLLNWQRK
jgi:hypothetical protein